MPVCGEQIEDKGPIALQPNPGIVIRITDNITKTIVEYKPHFKLVV
jgi:hypothetical protein